MIDKSKYNVCTVGIQPAKSMHVIHFQHPRREDRVTCEAGHMSWDMNGKVWSLRELRTDDDDPDAAGVPASVLFLLSWR